MPVVPGSRLGGGTNRGEAGEDEEQGTDDGQYGACAGHDVLTFE